MPERVTAFAISIASASVNLADNITDLETSFFGLPLSRFWLSVIRLFADNTLIPYYKKSIAKRAMANVLSSEKKALAMSLLAEGGSIRTIERITGVHRDTIMRLGVRVGEGCTKIMDAKMRDLNCQNVEVDEIWGFVSNRPTDWILRQGLMSSMCCSRNDIIMLPIPFTDLSRSKVRPAIVLGFGSFSGDLFVVPITSQAFNCNPR